MARRFYDLPSLTSLAAFEASARHGSFKLAAAELNVTPGAVSRQIKALEEEMGVALFDRLSTGVSLTADGQELYKVISSGFSRASETVQRIKRGNREKRVTLACSNAVATMWLMPRMGDFWRRYPDIHVDHLISDDARDYRRSEVDLRIRYGLGAWSDETAQLLFQDRLYPVCGSEYAQTHADRTAEDLPTLSLLHVDWLDAEWPGWDEFLRRAAIPHGPMSGRRFSSFAITMQAATENQGVAIGWHRLVHQLIADRKLTRLTDVEIPAPGAYYLTWNENRDLTSATETLRSWLVEMAAEAVA